MLTGFPRLTRCNTSLKEQFFYRYAIANTKAAGAFLAFFNESLAMLGFVLPDLGSVKVPENATVLRPFTWPVAKGEAI